MILVDTSVWIQHLRGGEPLLARRLEAGEVLCHPLVIGELAMGNLRRRDTVLDALSALPQAVVAADEEVLGFVAREALHGLGIGYADAHLLASTRLTPETALWTLDRRLAQLAGRMGFAAAPG